MPSHSYTYTSEFKSEFEVQRLELLHRRILWYCGVVVGMSLLATAFVLFFAFLGSKFESGKVLNQMTTPAAIVGWIGSCVSLVLYIAVFMRVRSRRHTKEELLRIVFWLIVISGALTLIQGPITASYLKESGGKLDTPTMHVDASDDDEAKPPEASPAPPAASADSTPDPGPVAAPSEAGARAAESPSAPGAVPAPASQEPSGAPAQTPKEKKPKKRVTVDEAQTALVTLGGLWSIFVSHFFACLFLPWTPRESIRPVVPLLVLNAVILLFYVTRAPIAIPILIVLSPLIAAPGAGICFWRNSRFRDSFTLNTLKGRYSEIRRELVDARRIHESLFPAPIRTGPVRLDYRYEPMRQIGGDYLYARQITASAGAHAGRTYTHIVLVDVTGHGITAALTVNRLHGEIDRQLGERPDASPGDLLTGLNSYLHHTLASHSVYATALCLCIDHAADALAWASAGHPPAFLRGADGTIDQLDSTTLVLGACKGDDFGANQQAVAFHRGDALVLYTDGAIECRNSAGRMLGVNGFRALLAGLRLPVGTPCLDEMIRAVDEHRFGPIQDDTLLVEVSRPV